MISQAAPNGRAALLSADEVAEWLGVSRRAVYDLARREHDPLPVVRLGRIRRFQPERVSAWLDAQGSR
ncbi:helix-turn-helix domain-containing protein [Svornostia abyssi]|uniref:Helix-turn-helix domain-containing protein n=1 Tax=Svornostia abyssi TaxID=2898438 RepID=A0ABY5PAN1_9ACTN|nr:helix-turn-helix domain-containing protein [Parviterribacteraceae bacterium J379]